MQDDPQSYLKDNSLWETVDVYGSGVKGQQLIDQQSKSALLASSANASLLLGREELWLLTTAAL